MCACAAVLIRVSMGIMAVASKYLQVEPAAGGIVCASSERQRTR
jgi:hypothetical protein